MLAEGRFVGADGRRRARRTSRTPPGCHLWFHRDFAPEEPVPFPIGVVYRDAHLVIADKPHFLATTPRGRHITETAVARLRGSWGCPRCSPRTGWTG